MWGLYNNGFSSIVSLRNADLRQDRDFNITLKEYFNFLMIYKDKRFAKDPRFPYLAANSFVRWQSANNVKYFINENDLKNMSITELSEEIKKKSKFYL